MVTSEGKTDGPRLSWASGSDLCRLVGNPADNPQVGSSALTAIHQDDLA